MTSISKRFEIQIDDESGSGFPELPRTTVDTLLDPAYDRPADVRVSSNLQQALDAAQPGQILELDNTETFGGVSDHKRLDKAASRT